MVKAQGLPLLNGTNTENHLFQVQVLKLGPGFDFINVISYIEFSLYGAIYCIPKNFNFKAKKWGAQEHVAQSYFLEY